MNYFFDVFAGLTFQERQHSPFNLKKNCISKLRSDNKVLFAVKIKPAVIKTRSHAAEDDQCTIIFPTLIRKKYICSTFIKIKKISKRKLHEDFFYCGEPF